MQFHGPFASLLNHERDVQPRLDRIRAHQAIHTIIAFTAWVALILIPVPKLVAADSGASTSTSLSADQVVDNLVRRNNERAQALLHSEGTRVYHLSYRGFPGDRDAEMVLKATYDRPSSKEFQVVSESGSKLILDRVFKKLLEGEKEAAQPAISARSQLNRDNYDFEMVGYEPSNTGGQYVLRVSPKSRSKYVYRGKVWVDGTDFAVTRIEAEPAQNPSFWTKKSEIHHEYKKVGAFWLPAKNESVSYVRLGGRATLTIEYKDYRVTAAGQPNGTTTIVSSDAGVR
jgi:membrane peptidoglycan carboxypeptidase